MKLGVNEGVARALNTPTLITWSNQCNLWSSDCSGWWKVSVNVRVGKSRFPPFLPITLTLPSTHPEHLPALTSYYSKQTNYMGIFTVSVSVTVARAHTTNTNLHPPEWETLWPISTGKCAGKSSVTRTSTRGNTLLPSTLTLLIGLRVTHSWGCVYVCVCVV